MKLFNLIFFACFSRLKVRIGDTNHASQQDDRNVVDLDITNQMFHPKYNKVVSYFDIAILETSPVTFSKAISPICLPNLPTLDSQKYDNYYAELIGWGQSSLHGKIADILKRVSLKIYPNR